MKKFLYKFLSGVGLSVENNQSVREILAKEILSADISEEAKVELTDNLGKDIHKENLWKIIGFQLLMVLALAACASASSSTSSDSSTDF